jgi:hypothetical protein
MARDYVRQPKKLAILVYGGRLGNAKGPSTDGWDYRGGGMMQTTGRTNYKKVGFEDNPDDLRDPDIAFETAVAEWENRGCNAIADGGDLKKLRRSINGGLNGFADFQDWIAKAKRVWPTAPRSSARPAQAVDTAEPDMSDKDTIVGVQTRLKELGYTEVGEVDGKIGKMTKTAILAFRNENDLPLSAEIDADLLGALGPQAKVRELATARVEAKPADVRAQVPEVQSNWVSKIGAYIVGIPSAIGVAITGVLDNLDGSRGYLEPVKDFIGDVPPVMWFALLAGGAAALWFVTSRGERKGIEAFQSGERR